MVHGSISRLMFGLTKANCPPFKGCVARLKVGLAMENQHPITPSMRVPRRGWCLNTLTGAQSQPVGTGVQFCRFPLYARGRQVRSHWPLCRPNSNTQAEKVSGTRNRIANVAFFATLSNRLRDTARRGTQTPPCKWPVLGWAQCFDRQGHSPATGWPWDPVPRRTTPQLSVQNSGGSLGGRCLGSGSGSGSGGHQGRGPHAPGGAPSLRPWALFFYATHGRVPVSVIPGPSHTMQHNLGPLPKLCADHGRPWRGVRPWHCRPVLHVGGC